jgi:hypothetical protein
LVTKIYSCEPLRAGRSVLGFNDFASLDAAGADSHPLGVRGAFHFGLHRTQVHIPATAGDVVCVRDVVSELRTFAANLAFLSHDSLPKLELLRRLHVAAFAARHVSIASGLKKAGPRRIMKKGSGLAAEFSVYTEPGDGCKSNR